MIINYDASNNTLEVVFEEEIDHHSCLKIAIMADDAIRKFMADVVIFDFSKVTFMDSSAIGMLLGRYRKIIRLGRQS